MVAQSADRRPRQRIMGHLLVRAAGGIVWRPGLRGIELALVHRPRQGDWSLPKGKLRRGESFMEAALREVCEETGCKVQLGNFAGASTYTSRRGPKMVLYWHMQLLRKGPLPPDGEVDEVAWLIPTDALLLLDRKRDRRLLQRVLASTDARLSRARPRAVPA